MGQPSRQHSSSQNPFYDLKGASPTLAWFSFDPCLAPTELQFSEDNCTVACEGYEHRVALGSVGFSRGVHYWEFSVNRYDSDTDPSFGIARLDVSKDQMLGELVVACGFPTLLPRSRLPLKFRFKKM
ncbi:unnamed protein product [Timema podura]|uniref:B30.2/SPRY domain-containing protein n=1 Tax=Timema podura TaxID=61482 RepID=A0ABN7PTW9_TIMPD|nr:unnamed protein product [Timema podura]